MSEARCLAEIYDTALLDLDGVVYLSEHAIPGVIEAINSARDDFGMTLTYVTNNASRSPESVSEHLNELGLHTQPIEVVTSAQAGAAELAKLVPTGSTVFVMGSKALMHEVELVGLVSTQDFDAKVDALIQGYWPDMPWRMIAQASGVLHRGVVWVATNDDLTIPTKWGIAPGNGSMIQILAQATGRNPIVIAGKPHKPLMQQSIDRTHANHPIVIGDRLDTDISGANEVGIDSLLVFSGVTDVRALLEADLQHRPTYISWTAQGVLDVHPAVHITDSSVSCGGWSFSDDELAGSGNALDAIRVAMHAAWGEFIGVDAVFAQIENLGISTSELHAPSAR